MSADWKAGDLAVKVAGPCKVIPKGTVVRVASIHAPHLHSNNELGLVLQGAWERMPGTCSCFTAQNFRKLNDGTDDAELIERIRKCKPARQPEPAL